MEPTTLDALAPDAEVAGFVAEAVYLDDAGAPMGARLVHDHTGFVLDLVRIQSVPQAFVWVHTVPVSERGEPHTQEHLLLGKGNKGRATAALESMSLVESTAFTDQLKTAYHMHTAAGPEVFFRVLEADLDALLNPDYTDEEIRREVHHFGPTETGLEEKGTVYNEMVSSTERKWGRLWREIEVGTYGEGHPLALNAGGMPEAIREMEPEHIRSFHAETYVLGNMGAIVALPPEVPLEEALGRLDALLVRLQPEPGDPREPEELPPPRPLPSGEVRFVDYPSDDPTEPAEMVLMWPPAAEPDLRERLTLNLLLATLANTEASDLYKKLVASETRVIDVGATEVSAWASDDLGMPVYAYVGGIPAANRTEEDARAVREVIVAQLREVAAWSAEDPAFVDFERRLGSQLVATARQYRKRVATPPEFGIRGTGPFWIDHLDQLDAAGGFRRSLTLGPAFERIEAEIAAGGNPWAAHLDRLLEVAPTVLVTRPSPDLLSRLEAERTARIEAELASIEDHAAFSAEYAEATAELEAIAAEVTIPAFLDTPPMDLDPFLAWERREHDGIPLVASTFTGMSGGTVGLALRLDGVPMAHWDVLAGLASLVGRVGVLEDGTPIPYPEVVERLQNETLSVEVSLDPNTEAGKPELVLTGTGTTPEETRAALRWMARMLHHPDWRPENLPRIRDVLEEDLVRMRRRTDGPEETWVTDPERAWRWQRDPLRFATASFLTRRHALFRLRWRLMGRDEEAAATLEALAIPDRAAAEAAVASLREGGPVLREAAADLGAALAEVPDATLAEDVAYVLGVMATGLREGPEPALADLQEVRRLVADAAGARLWQISGDDPVGQASRLPSGDIDLSILTADLAQSETFVPVERPEADWGWDRLRQHSPEGAPVYVGLVMPAMQGGVFTLTTPMTSYRDTGREDLLRYLAALSYSGHGPHGLFMKTWGAGLAYSNGARPDVRHGRMRYYAERCPELPQTLAFVVDVMEEATVDAAIAEYSLAAAFSTRSADTYEARGAAIAHDLDVGLAPEVVQGFRAALLDLRDDPELPARIAERIPLVYGEVLPGLGVRSAEVEGGVFFTIGPERQHALLETHLREVEGPDVVVHRLYPRDFWFVR